MANTTTTTTTGLNPFAPPYHKLPSYYQPPNTHINPRNLFTHVPCGPRIIPPSRRHRRREVQKPIPQWLPKPNVTGKPATGFQGRRKRWKNRSGGYHKLLKLDANTTSVMIKNIPARYTRDLLILTLDNHCKKFINDTDFISAYDFLYLPIDFKSRLNAGFAFVNFTNPKAALRFKEAFDGKTWALFDSSKVARISKAKIQGKRAIINFYKNMDFSGGLDGDFPVLFEPARDGSGRVVSKMFKLGKN